MKPKEQLIEWGPLDNRMIAWYTEEELEFIRKLWKHSKKEVAFIHEAKSMFQGRLV